MESNMINENLKSSNVRNSNDNALENLTKAMLREINKTKSSPYENFNVNELRKTIKDLIERSELNNENN